MLLPYFGPSGGTYFQTSFPDDTFYSYAAKAGGFPTTPADGQDILRGVGLSGERKYRNLSRLEIFLFLLIKFDPLAMVFSRVSISSLGHMLSRIHFDG